MRMAFIVADEHYSQIFRANLIKQVVGEAFKVGPPEALIRLMKSARVLSRSIDDVAQLCVELLREAEGNLAVVVQSLLNVPPDQRVIDYFHVARSCSMEAQNSSEFTGRTWPESSSSRRRVASSMSSALASS